MNDPYVVCPAYETEQFILRLIAEADAEGLLPCYSDKKAQKFFNADKCSGDFCMDKLEDMVLCIRAWLDAYAQQDFIRFSIIDKSLSRAIGTIEMFGYIGKYKVKTGILRVDVSSGYENEEDLREIFDVCSEHFFDLFEVDVIATKAIPEAVERRNALQRVDFCEGEMPEREHYFLRSNKARTTRCV